MAITGLTSQTKKNIQLDAGALYKNYNPASDTPATASAKLIGATEGGASLSIVPEVRQIAVDGAKGPTKGFEVIDSWTATLSATMKEVKADTVALALGAATTTSSTSPASYSKVVPDGNYEDSDYLTNVTWIGKIIGSANPCMIVLKNALCTNGFTMQAADKAEGTFEVVLTAHYDVSSLDEVPVEFYLPTVSTT